MNAQSSNSRTNISLIIHQDDLDTQIDFTFDLKNDNIDDVVNELVETLQLSEDERLSIKSMIEKQVNRQGLMDVLGIDDTSEVLDDFEYQNLLVEQKKEIETLLDKHVNERKELEKKYLQKKAVFAEEDLIIFS